jgi:general secretion pathway protein L
MGSFALPAEASRLRNACRGATVLALAIDQPALRREVALPLAAEAGLMTVLRYEMDRLTPFAPEDVVWDGQLLRRDRVRGVLLAALVLLPRVRIETALAKLKEAGVSPGWIEAAAPDGTLHHLPLAPPDPARARRQRHRLIIAWSVAGALAAACLVAPLVRETLALAGIEDQIAALKPRVAEAQALQRQIAAAQSGDDALSLGRLHASDALTALAALTDALPDSAYLTQLAIQQKRMTMEGQTHGEASRLIAALAEQTQLRNPAFTAPVVRGDAGNEIFALQVDLAP